MSLAIAPNATFTFTITGEPRRPAERKTLQRLMRMQPEIQGGLTKLARKRRQTDNNRYIRAGKWWTDRARTTKLTRVAPGESFTLHVTPQIVGDLNSVGKYLDAKSA